jgi:hypothetical protein
MTGEDIMRSVVKFGLAAAALGLLAPGAWAGCGSVKSAMTTANPATTTAGVERPANLAGAANLAALGANSGNTTTTATVGGSNLSLAAGNATTSSTSAAEHEANPVLR